MEELNIKVKGMHCEGCEKRIKNALEDIKGVKEVEADYKKGIVTVEAKAKIADKTLEDTIEHLGFEVEDIKRK